MRKYNNQKGFKMTKYQYYIVRDADAIGNAKRWDIVRGYWTYSAPFHPTDNSRVYVLNGSAIGNKARDGLLKSGAIQRLKKSEAVKNLLNNLR